MTRTNSVAAVCMVFLVALAGATGAAAGDYTAPPSTDTSTTDDTASTTELTAGENRTFNQTQNETIQWIAPSNETQVTIARNGSDHDSYANGSAAVAFWNATDGDGHYNATVDHSQLLDTEHAIGENVTMNMTFVDNASLDDANQSVGAEQWYLEFDNSTTTEVVTTSDVDAGEIVTVTNESGFGVFGVSIFGADESEIETERQVNGSNTDVYVAFSDSNVSEDFTDATEGAAAGDKLSALSMSKNVMLVESDDGEMAAVPVYYQEAPDDVSEDDTYAVQQDVGGTEGVAVNLGSEFDDADSVTVTTVGSAGFTTFLTTYVRSSFSNAFGMFMSTGSLSLAFIAPIGLRRRAQEGA